MKNYRTLRDFRLKRITPLTVFVGVNGSGKSTVLDVFAFLSEIFTVGLRQAWDSRGRFKELRTRGVEEPIEIELRYRECPDSSLIIYHLSIQENNHGPYIQEEWLQWRRLECGKLFKFLDFKEGKGQVISGDNPEESDCRIEEELESSEVLAVNILGQLARNLRVCALRRFITGWYFSGLITDNTRPNVMQYLKEHQDSFLPKLIGIKEPENHVYPRLLPELTEEFRMAAIQTQLMVITYSPFFVNGLRPDELWVLNRDEQGYTQTHRVGEMLGINEFIAHGALLGHLWMEGNFEL